MKHLRPALFLVPTCLLVEQQAYAVRQHTGLRVCEYMGGLQMPATFDVLVSTPDAFRKAQATSGSPHISWPVFNLVVYDEVSTVASPQLSLLLLLTQFAFRSPRALMPCCPGLTAAHRARFLY